MDATLTGSSTVKLSTGEEVEVLQLPIKHYTKLIEAMAKNSEADMIALYCGKPAEWIDSLSPQDWEALVVEGEKVNGDFFARWVERQRARQERLMPGVTEKVVNAALASPNLSPRSAPQPDSAGPKLSMSRLRG